MKGIKKMLIVKKSSIITLCLISILIVAGYLNYINTPTKAPDTVTVNNTAPEDIFEGEEPETFGEARFVDNSTNTSLRYERDKKRSEIAAMYKEISQNKEASKELTDQAAAEAMRVLKDSESEINIESILSSKNFENPFVYITADGVTVFVENEKLIKTDIALIAETVIAETGVTSDKIRINPASNL